MNGAITRPTECGSLCLVRHCFPRVCHKREVTNGLIRLFSQQIGQRLKHINTFLCFPNHFIEVRIVLECGNTYECILNLEIKIKDIHLSVVI